jgi:hypothetical protein
VAFSTYNVVAYNGSAWVTLDKTFTTYTNGTWHFLALVSDGANLQFYRDGVQTTNVASSWSSFVLSRTTGQTMNMMIYSDAVTGPLPNGTMIDDMIIWSTNLPLSAITNRMAHTHPMTNTELRADNDYTLGNGNVAGFGPVKIWKEYGDVTNEWWTYKSGVTNWGL